tara:strand:+ start:41 stop:1570 length:1530 start_codon:yes stop_codon:yes gene_type:complete
MSIQATVQYLNKEITLPEKFKDHTNHGILTLTTPEQDNKEPQTNAYHMIFTLDRSGSMDGVTPSDSTSKIQQVKVTCRNIIHWMNEDSNNYSVSIILFDYETTILIEHEPVTKENLDSIILKIESIRTRGTTNIEKAIIESHTLIETYNNPDIENIHIFMTDGIPTEGETIRQQLAKLILDYKLKHVGTEHFIGFGEDHDSYLLESFAKIYDDNYHFIDSYENGGMVYGEILYNMIYKFCDNLTLTCNNFKIYNYKTNTWENSYTIHSLSYNTTKTFYILKEHETDYTLGINYNSVITYEDAKSEEETYVINHLWRFTVLKVLYLMKEENNTQMVKQTLRELKDYMTTTNQEQKEFLKVLCDDLYITKKVQDTIYKRIYLHGRHTSQGEQRGYTVKNIDHILGEWEELEDPHQFSQDSATPFASVEKRSISRTISGYSDEIKRARLNNNPRSTSLNLPGASLQSPPHKLVIPGMTRQPTQSSYSLSPPIRRPRPTIKIPEIPDFSNMHA